MSRGLGKLQRTIKALIEAQDERFHRECDADPEGDLPECHFWLTWSEIRFRLYEDHISASEPWHKWLALERAAKRALHTLWKRGEIGRLRHNDRFAYMSAETYNESFSPKAMEGLKEALERMEIAEAAE